MDYHPLLAEGRGDGGIMGTFLKGSAQEIIYNN